jgi:Tol biopolymer transport system component
MPRGGRRLRPGQRAVLVVLDVGSGTEHRLLTSRDRLIEAPCWHPEGEWIVVNADGLLFRVPARVAATPEQIPADGLPPVNNDHILSPDGSWHLVSADDGHLYRLPWGGGAAERISSDKPAERSFRHFLHGISPDGRTVAYVGTELLSGDTWGTRALWTLDLETGREDLVGTGFSPADGPEFSPDGTQLYFNSEVASPAAGHAQLFRITLADGELEQLTDDERVNWFPHVSPDGRLLSYLSYPAGTGGHPADLPVELRLIELSTGERRDLASLPGGQGTINVNSWAPDSTRFAYVAYPITAEERA